MEQINIPPPQITSTKEFITFWDNSRSLPDSFKVIMWIKDKDIRTFCLDILSEHIKIYGTPIFLKDLNAINSFFNKSAKYCKKSLDEETSNSLLKGYDQVKSFINEKIFVMKSS